MCANCEIYGADHEMPTEPGFRAPPRIRRQFDRSFDAVVFDLPVVPVTYVGTRKSTLAARRREITLNLWFSAVIAAIGLTVITLAL